jgi:hypothetical protein
LREEEAVLFSFSVLVVAGVALLYLAMNHRRAIREMEHRERLAMIQQGLIPAPEADPLGFEAATEPAPGSVRADRWRSAGVVLIGLGLALFFLLTFTASTPGAGVGIGGAFAVLGGTLVFHSTQISTAEARRHRGAPGGRPAARTVEHRPAAAAPPAAPSDPHGL